MRQEKYDQIGPESRASQFAAGKPGGLGAGIQIEFRVPGRACLVKARQKAGWSNAGLFGIKSVLLKGSFSGLRRRLAGFWALAVP